jgi:hypothetical protein
MVFKSTKFNKFTYKRKSYLSGIQVECEMKQNGRKIDFVAFNDNNSYKRATNIFKKYGFYQDYDKQIAKDVKEEIDNLNKFCL